MSHLSEWNPVDIPSGNLKAALQVNFRTSSEFSDDECIRNLQDDITADCLYYEEIINGPPLVYRLIRDYFILKGFKYRKQRNQKDIAFELSQCFFDDEDDKKFAEEQLEYIRSRKTTIAPSTHAFVQKHYTVYFKPSENYI